MSALETQELDKCLCGAIHPCRTHSPEAIVAAYRALGPAPAGCKCRSCDRSAIVAILGERPPAPKCAHRGQPLRPAAAPPMQPRLFPVAPLVSWIDDAMLDSLNPVERRKLRRVKAKPGLTEDEADDMAVLVGCHPAEIWPDLWAAP